MTFRNILLASVGMAWVAAASAAAAQTAAADGDGMAGQGQLQDIVVTAQKRAESSQKTPISISVVSGDDLVNRSANTLQDIQSQTPGLVFEQGPVNQFGVATQMRGISGKGSAEASAPIYINGIYMSAQTSGTNAGAPSAALLDIARVEVLKGPQGTLYGRNSTGGSINVVENAPKLDVVEGYVKAGVGNYNLRTASGVVNVPLVAESIGLRVAGLVTHQGAVVRNAINGTPILNRDEEAFRAALRFNPGDGALDATLRGDYYHAKGGGQLRQPVSVRPGAAALVVAIESGLNPFTNPAAVLQGVTTFQTFLKGGKPSVSDVFYNAPTSARVETYGGSFEVSYDIGGATLKSLTGYRHYEASSREDYDGTPFEILRGFVPYRYNQFSEELQLAGSALDGKLKYVVGGFYFNLKIHEQGVTSALPPLNPANPASRNYFDQSKSYSAFGQATYEITDSLNVTGGLRYTSEDKTLTVRNTDGLGCALPPPELIGGQCLARYKTSFTNVSYIGGVNYFVTPQVMIYGTVSTGFKSGGTNLGDRRPGSFVSYKPEKVDNYEIGFKGDLLDRRLRVNVSAFQMKYSDIQKAVVVATAGGGIFTITQNAASARITGVEMEVTALPVKGLELRGTLNYLKPKYLNYVDASRDRSNEKFDNQPRWQYSLSAAYTAETGIGDARAQIDWSWRGSVDLFPAAPAPRSNQFQPSYGLLNGRLSLEVESADLTIAAYGKNLLDKRYFGTITDLNASLGFGFGIVGMPRTYGLEITKRF